MFSQSHEILKQITNEINNLNSQIEIGVGGVHVTNSVSDENTFNKFVNELKNVDYFFYTNLDLSFINFIKVFNEKENFSLLAQVVIRFEKKRIFAID